MYIRADKKFNATPANAVRSADAIHHIENYLHNQPEESVCLARLHFQKFTVREIAGTLGRATSTITQELSGNIIDAHIASKAALVCAAERRIQARHVPKMHQETVLFGIVYHLLCIRWSTEQISMTLSVTYPKGHRHRVSHEIIYNCIYAQPVLEFNRDLIKALRQGHNKRVHRRKGQNRRCQIPHFDSIHVHLPEIEDRQLPVYWEGYLIKSKVNGNRLVTLVEHRSRLLMLVKLPKVKLASLLNVFQEFTDKLVSVANPLRLSIKYDKVREMTMQKELSKRTGIAVYFCDLHSPWQRASKENMNGFVSQYLHKGTDLSIYSYEVLDAIENEINNLT